MATIIRLSDGLMIDILTMVNLPAVAFRSILLSCTRMQRIATLEPICKNVVAKNNNVLHATIDDITALRIRRLCALQLICNENKKHLIF